MATKENKDQLNKESKEDKSEKSGSKVGKVVALRNRFFFMLYRYTTLVFVTSILCCIFSITFLVFFAKQPVPPQYIPTTEDGRYIKLTPLSECKTDAEVKKFVMSAIGKLYRYDYVNFSEQLQGAAPYFAGSAWNEYLDDYARSNTLASVKENNSVVTVQINSVPLINKKSIENGVCTWEIETDLTVMFIGNNSQSQKGKLYVRLIRNSVINNPEGLGISRVVYKLS